MRYFFLTLGFIVALFIHSAIADRDMFGNIQDGGVITAAIDSPTTGQTVQGEVVIRGSNAVDGFQSYEIDFAALGDPTQAWIPIENSTEPIHDGVMAVWDTRLIADADYSLRLLILKTDGSMSVVTVREVHVRNNTSVELSAATPAGKVVIPGAGTPMTAPISQQTQPLEATSPPSTPTPLPKNPAEISAPQVLQTFGTGAALSIGVFVLLGTYIGIRAILNGRK
jgi:hypothetical protein